jgi:hypothetical protein
MTDLRNGESPSGEDYYRKAGAVPTLAFAFRARFGGQTNFGSSQNFAEGFSPPVHGIHWRFGAPFIHNQDLPLNHLQSPASEPLGGSSSEAGGKIPAVHENVRRAQFSNLWKTASGLFS